jgi:hypothetical protein
VDRASGPKHPAGKEEQAMSKKWRTVRVVVEVKVPPNDNYGQRSLRRWLHESISWLNAQGPSWLLELGPLQDPKVKFYSNIQNYEKRKTKQ